MSKAVPPIQRVKEKKKFDVSQFQEIYEFDTILPGCGEPVRFRPLTTGQIKKVLAFENEENPMVISELMNTLIKEVVINDIDVHEIFLKDRAFLLWEMRNKSKGTRWETQYTCEKCKSQNLLVTDLSKFTIKNLDLHNVEYIIDIFPGLQLEMKFLKVIDELESLNFINAKMSDSQKQAELTVVLHAAGINKIIKGDEIFEDLSLSDRKYFIEEMPTVVYESISNWYKENDYGVDFTIEHKCTSCGNVMKFEGSPDSFFL